MIWDAANPAGAIGASGRGRRDRTKDRAAMQQMADGKEASREGHREPGQRGGPWDRRQQTLAEGDLRRAAPRQASPGRTVAGRVRAGVWRRCWLRRRHAGTPKVVGIGSGACAAIPAHVVGRRPHYWPCRRTLAVLLLRLPPASPRPHQAAGLPFGMAQPFCILLGRLLASPPRLGIGCPEFPLCPACP